MSAQIFKKIIPMELFFSLLDETSSKNEKHYVFNHASYKKGIFNGVISTFLENCKQYYHTSKYNDVESYYSLSTMVENNNKLSQKNVFVILIKK